MERPVMKLLTNFYGQKWRAALTGYGQSSQYANFWKIAKMALFNQSMKFNFFLGQMTSFEVIKNTHV